MPLIMCLDTTIANDVTARDLQRRDSQWTRGKGFDTFCPLGPWIETELDPTDALITCHVDDELRQMAYNPRYGFYDRAADRLFLIRHDASSRGCPPYRHTLRRRDLW